MSTSTYVPCHCSTHVACSRNIFKLVIGNYSHSLLDWPKPPSSSLASYWWTGTQPKPIFLWKDKWIWSPGLISLMFFLGYDFSTWWYEQTKQLKRVTGSQKKKKNWAQTRSYLKKQTDVSLCKLKCSYTLKSALPMLIPIGYKQQRKWVNFSLSGGWWGGEHSVLSFKYTRRCENGLCTVQNKLTIKGRNWWTELH